MTVPFDMPISKYFELLDKGYNKSEMAAELGIASSTIGKWIKRNEMEINEQMTDPHAKVKMQADIIKTLETQVLKWQGLYNKVVHFNPSELQIAEEEITRLVAENNDLKRKLRRVGKDE